jgi:hypothetical protein
MTTLCGQIGNAMISVSNGITMTIACCSIVGIAGLTLNAFYQSVKSLKFNSVKKWAKRLIYILVSSTPTLFIMYCLHQSSFEIGQGDLAGVFEYGIPFTLSLIPTTILFMYFDALSSLE